MWPTPSLVIDLDIVRANVNHAARQAADKGYLLRPHAKTHKSLNLARMQLAAGAVGLTVATIGEAEVFAAVCSDLFIAYPLWVDEGKADRLNALSAAGVQLRIGVDSLQSIANVARRHVSVHLMIELDSGHHRSGARLDEVVALVQAATAAGLPVAGIFTFPGHSYSVGGRATAAITEATTLARAQDLLTAAGHPADVISGGSTPSLSGIRPGTLTEARPGVYLLNDAQQWELGSAAPEQLALACEATVVSHAGGRVIVDAGSKVMGADRASWATGYGRLVDQPEARVIAQSEHHATIDWPGALPQLGSRIRVIPNHACTAMNLADSVIVEDDTATLIWPIDARGKNS